MTTNFNEGNSIEESENDTPCKALFHLILRDAIEKEASDIYIERYDKLYRARYRMNGELHEMMRPPTKLSLEIRRELKLLFGLLEKKVTPLTIWDKINNKISVKYKHPKIEWLPQSNPQPYIRIKSAQQEVNLSLSILQTSYENYRIQLFNQKYLEKPLNTDIVELLTATNTGLIVITNPSGEGKTTTAYQILNYLNKHDQKIITIEQKRSYHLDGIDHIVANPQHPSYNDILTSIRNQQPNIIFFDDVDLEDQVTIKEAMNYAQNNTLILAAITAKNPKTCFKYLQNTGASTADIKAIIPSKISYTTP